MHALVNDFLMAWIPLFVAIDPIGMAGMFMGLTSEMEDQSRRRIAWQASATAFLVAVGFMVLGRFIFKAIGISIADFQIAGGLILLIVAARSLLDYEKKSAAVPEDFGVVPLGLPIIAGPAMLSAVLLLMETVGWAMTVFALSVNIATVYVCFRYVKVLMRVIGKRGVKAVSKIIALLLVAIAIHMIRVGIQTF